MSTISTKINLCALKHARRMMKGESGEMECLIIPINQNKLFVGEKGVYVDLIGFQIKDQKGKETHIIKQSVPKEMYDAMTEQERNELPTMGSHIVWDGERAIGAANVAPLTNEDDDLPF